MHDSSGSSMPLSGKLLVTRVVTVKPLNCSAIVNLVLTMKIITNYRIALCSLNMCGIYVCI